MRKIAVVIAGFSEVLKWVSHHTSGLPLIIRWNAR